MKSIFNKKKYPCDQSIDEMGAIKMLLNESVGGNQITFGKIRSP